MPDTNGLWYRLWHLDKTLSSLAALSHERRDKIIGDRVREVYGSTDNTWYRYWHPDRIASSFTYRRMHAIGEGQQQEGHQSEHRTFGAGGSSETTSRGPVLPQGKK